MRCPYPVILSRPIMCIRCPSCAHISSHCIQSTPHHTPLPSQALDHSIARDIVRGLAGLDRLVADHGLSHVVHGRLIDLIDCPPQLSLAVEVTAGGCFVACLVRREGAQWVELS